MKLDDTGFILPHSFWTNFIQSSWNKEPVLIRTPFKTPLLTESDFFQILSRAGDDYRCHVRRALTFWIDQGCHICDIEDSLPHAADSSLDAYKSRLSAAIGDRATTLTVYGCQWYSYGLWMGVRRFLHPLYSRVGMPISKVDLDSFFGTYSRTPTGIHRDDAANFSYVVAGTKRMLFWPSEVFNDALPLGGSSLGTAQYERYMDKAIEIEAKTGDIIFWPPSYWHLAISDGGWQATLNIALYLGNNLLQLFHHVLADPELAAPLAPFRIHSTIPIPEDRESSLLKIPASLLRQAEVFREIAGHPSLNTSIEDRWFRKLSASGFDVVPPPAGAPDLDETYVVRGNPEFPILLVPRNGSKATIFANGNRLDTIMSETLSAMIGQLNSGNEFSLREFVLMPSAQVDSPSSLRGTDLIAILTFLCRQRSIQCRPESSKD